MTETFYILTLEKLDRSSLDALLSTLTSNIHIGIQYIIKEKNCKRNDKIIIVSHEYLYGHDLSKKGFTLEEKNKFITSLSLFLSEITRKYNIDILLAPGTIVWENEENKYKNTACFFNASDETVQEHHKDEGFKFIPWGNKKIITLICGNSANYKPLPSDILFIPSSGIDLMANNNQYFKNVYGLLNPRPGCIIINIDECYGIKIYLTTIEFAQVCLAQPYFSINQFPVRDFKDLLVASQHDKINVNLTLSTIINDQQIEERTLNNPRKWVKYMPSIDTVTELSRIATKITLSTYKLIFIKHHKHLIKNFNDLKLIIELDLRYRIGPAWPNGISYNIELLNNYEKYINTPEELHFVLNHIENDQINLVKNVINNSEKLGQIQKKGQMLAHNRSVSIPSPVNISAVAPSFSLFKQENIDQEILHKPQNFAGQAASMH